MNVKLEKWYLDFISGKTTGFYYIMRIRFGRLIFGFSGINHFDAQGSVRSFKCSRVKRISLHSLELSKARLSSCIKAARLRVDHGRTSLRGTWTFLAPPLSRPRKPLYRNAHGFIDWKVWTPRAQVDLVFRRGKICEALQGSGYIDFVRMTIPFWKMPFEALYWGRMHSQRSWSVFLCLRKRNEKVALFRDPQTAVQEASVFLERNDRGEAQSMVWTAGSADDPIAFKGRVTRILESEDVLSKGKALWILPKGIRRMLSSSGRDEKYQVVSQHGGQTYRGIMEEVTYHG